MAQVYGVDLSAEEQVIIVITVLLAPVGADSIPVAGPVMLTVTLTTAGLPPEGIGLMLAVDLPPDMTGTTINAWSDSCGAATIARPEIEETNVVF